MGRIEIKFSLGIDTVAALIGISGVSPATHRCVSAETNKIRLGMSGAKFMAVAGTEPAGPGRRVAAIVAAAAGEVTEQREQEKVASCACIINKRT